MNVKQICQGDAGLAVTYWGYGVVGSVLLGIPLAFVTPGSVLAIFAAFSCIGYALLVNFGVWRAAGKYQGPKIWSFLARAAIVLALAFVVIGIGAAILIPRNINSNHVENGNTKAPDIAQNVGCKRTMTDVRAQRPDWANLSDDSLVNLIRNAYYPENTVDEIAKMLCVELTLPKQLEKLGPVDSWRYDSCRKEAAHAPTTIGVNIGLGLCKKRFGQS